MGSANRAGSVSKTPGKGPRRVLLLLMLLPLLMLLALNVVRPEDGAWPLTAALAVCAVAGFGLVRSATPAAAGWLVSLTTVVLFAAGPEVALRLAGYRHDVQGGIQFGYPRPELFTQFERDPELFWALPRTLEGVNRQGFIGSDWVLPKPAGVTRLVFFGDSCTQQGFPEGVAAYLRQGGDGEYDAINLGVSGYTSYQGRVLAGRWSEGLEPDVSLIYFGWNDHWLAWGEPDAEKAARYRTTGALTAFIDASRVGQWIAERRMPRPESPTDRPRVSQTEYRQNLTEIGRTVAGEGSRVVLITAPASHRRLGVPDRLVQMGQARDTASVLELHDAYNAIVREVAADQGWELLDLAAEADRLPDPQEMFLPDGIHFTRSGLHWIASRIAEHVGGDPSS
ncbi:hypothetical protein ABI59_00725 [Acidobacteria bacterium Mor1]|nr:hypothetical protein ABI59_00725 [Acidobacteria bacterium Mor1]